MLREQLRARLPRVHPRLAVLAAVAVAISALAVYGVELLRSDSPADAPAALARLAGGAAALGLSTARAQLPKRTPSAANSSRATRSRTPASSRTPPASASRPRPPSRTASPSASAPSKVTFQTLEASGRDGRRFVHLLGCPEGTSGWVVALSEAMTLAAQLQRVLVLPCVRAGQLVPCSPGQVMPVPPEEEAGAAAGGERSGPEPSSFEEANAADTRAFRAFRNDCEGSQLLSPAHGWAYPLHAYFSRAGIEQVRLAAQHRTGSRRVQLIDFDEWASLRKLGLVSQLGRVHADAAPALHFGDQHVCLSRAPSWNGTLQLGSWVFAQGVQCGSLQGDVARMLLKPQGANIDLRRFTRAPWARVADVFILEWKRARTHHERQAAELPSLHPAHAAAAARWARHIILRQARAHGGPRAVEDAQAALASHSRGYFPSHYAVIQWRSETLGERLGACATRVARTVSKLAHRLAESKATAAMPIILASDLRGPSNPCAHSLSYQGSGGKSVEAAVAPLLSARGLYKYDDDVLAHAGVPLDAGVLALREYVLSSRAQRYGTCNTRFNWEARGRYCRRCAWPSEFVHRTVMARTNARLPSVEDMLDIASWPPAPRMLVADPRNSSAAAC